jgi:putative RNA 2'-phosphotransferase
VRTSDKQRFAIEVGRIRANQGHSVPIELGLTAVEPPARLYHGTVERFLAAIEREGLIRGDRQFVHLSADRETAERVGARRGKSVVLIVDAAGLHRAGEPFFRAENGVWLVGGVPPQYVSRA